MSRRLTVLLLPVLILVLWPLVRAQFSQHTPECIRRCYQEQVDAFVERDGMTMVSMSSQCESSAFVDTLAAHWNVECAPSEVSRGTLTLTPTEAVAAIMTARVVADSDPTSTVTATAPTLTVTNSALADTVPNNARSVAFVDPESLHVETNIGMPRTLCGSATLSFAVCFVATCVILTVL
ncbi:hypothetical protein JCM10212_006747 [Sporobolomyces blumeae]